MSVSNLTINGQPAATLGVVSARLTYREMAEDTLELTINRPLSESPLTGAITASIGPATFTGTVQSPSRNGEGGQPSRHSIRAVGKWDDMARTIYTQNYPFDSFAGQDPRVLLGGKYEPDVFSNGDTSRDAMRIEAVPISETLADAVSKAGFGSGSGAPTVIVPPAQGEGITCADVIRTLLRWVPGIGAGFRGGSTLQFWGSVSGPAPAPYTIPRDKVKSVALRERDDLALRGVVLLFTKQRQSPLFKDEVPTEVTAGAITGARVLRQRIDLMPEVHQLSTAPMEIASINASNIDWWRARDAWFDQIKASLGAEISDPQDVEIIREDNSLSNELRGGSIPKAFETGCEGPFHPDAKILTVGNGTTPKTGAVNISATFKIGEDIPPYMRSISVRRTVSLIGTSLNGLSGDNPSLFVREDFLARDLGENPATYAALPAAILAASQAYHTEGTISWLGVADPTKLGHGLTCAGLVNTDSPIVELTIDMPESGPTISTARFGIPPWLGASDLVELQRAARPPRPKRALVEKESGGERPVATPDPVTGPPPSPSNQPPKAYGRVRVLITPPEAVEAGAAWRASRQDGGGTVGPYGHDQPYQMPAGVYAIEFLPVIGWQPPKPILEYNVGSGATTTISGEEAKYEEAGAGGGRAPFQLLPTVADAGDPPPARIRVIYGEIEGEPPTGIATLLSPANGHHVYLIITRHVDTRAITSRTIGSGATLPSDTETLLHVDLGTVALADNRYTITEPGWTGNIYPSEEIVVINGDMFYRTAQMIGGQVAIPA